MIRRVLPAAAVLLLVIGARGFALELSQGRIRVDVSASTGRFIAYYRATGNDWTPLFYSLDPRTTVLEIRAGRQLYRMGDDSRFRQSVKRNDGGAEIAWTSKSLSVTESFSFVSSVGASQSDGFLIDINITNTGQQPVSVGARYVIDTSLGEQSHIEFVTPNDGSMSNETQFEGRQIPAYWASPLNQRMTVALEAVLRAPGVTVPNRIIFANWKRLYESGWRYSYDPTRNFNFLPYSINDSAVAMYYDPQSLAPGASRSITLLLGQYSSEGWGNAAAPQTAAASTASATAQPPAAPAPAPAQPAPQSAPAQPSATQPAPAQSQPTAPKPAAQPVPAPQPSGVPRASATQPTAPAPQSSATPSTTAPGGTASPAARSNVVAGLGKLNSTLERIQKLLSNPGAITPAELEAMRQELAKLASQKQQLQQQ